MATYSAEQVLALLDTAPVDPTGAREVRVPLAPGDTAWDPGTTKYAVSGPGVVTYTQYVDGGVDAELDGA